MTHRSSCQLFCFLPILSILAFPAFTHAQISGVQGKAEREIQKRQSVADGYAPDMIHKGESAMLAKDYESAFSFYRAAVDALPPAGAAVNPVRTTALDGFCRAAISLARQRISEGRIADAEEIVGVVLTPKYNLNYKPALTLEKQLKDPAVFNRTITPKFVGQIEDVKRLLTEADGYYQSGRYDLAFQRYEQVINIDKYNIAARRGMERVNGARQSYATTARNQTRGDMITTVAKGWELPVRRYDLGVSAIVEQPQISMTGTQVVNDKLQSIIIPKIDFTESSVPEALDFIKRRSVALDISETDPSRKGVNIVLMLDPAAQAALPKVTLSLRDVPLGNVLNYVAEATGLKTKIETYAVALVPLNVSTEVLLTKQYNVPPSFMNGPSGGGGATALTTRAGAKQALEAQGVLFPEGASAQFVSSTSKLIVRNTPANLSMIDALVENALSTPPTQIQIQSKFLEVGQNNAQELGLDWLMGKFMMPFGSGVAGSGGTQGNQLPANAVGNYPMSANGRPVGASTVTNGNVEAGQMTAGLRSGSASVKANALDGLLFASPVGPAPGILALAGVFTNPQFQVVLRALNQAKGVDLLSAPTVTTKSGQQANIEIIQEFIYPDTFTPPTVPATSAAGQIAPATPATPASFAMQPVGVTLNVLPTIGPDGFTIDLTLHPTVTEFDGFVNYGSQISTTAPVFGLLAVGGFIPILGSQSIVLTENTINQPIFSVREVETSVTVYDGQTVALGGLIREDVQATADKVPILGDIPLLGRAFRVDGTQHIKKNLIIFVTSNLIDPAGQPLIKEVEDDTVRAMPSEKLLMDEIIPGDSSSIAPKL